MVMRVIRQQWDAYAMRCRHSEVLGLGFPSGACTRQPALGVALPLRCQAAIPLPRDKQGLAELPEDHDAANEDAQAPA